MEGAPTVNDVRRLRSAWRELAAERFEICCRIDRLRSAAEVGVGSAALIDQLEAQELALAGTMSRLRRRIDALSGFDVDPPIYGAA